MSIGREPGKFISTGRGDGQAVDMLNRLFIDAANMGASDIHFESGDKGETVIRYRISGILQEIDRVPQQIGKDIDSKVRAKCRMSLSERMDSQDGRMFIEVDDRVIDVRVSLLPCRTGQSLVCRLLDQRNAARKIHDVQMTDEVRTAIMDILCEPDGLVLMTGPTGSGKTSTLYAMLNHLNEETVKIITVEDPVEYRLDRAIQVNVNEKLTFARALRSILRQDPDVILVGEIRDPETAKTAVEASLTGHLVLSTLHANDAATTLTRMVDLGVDPFTLGATLRGVISQRLIRRLCPHCRVEYRPVNGEREWLDFHAPKHAHLQFFHANPDGCDYCDGGFDGRMPVMEMVTGDAHVRHAVLTNDRQEITRAARKQKQYMSLMEAGMLAAVRGETTLLEVRRISANIDYRHSNTDANSQLPRPESRSLEEQQVSFRAYPASTAN
jgi:type II secretory ATPase GspE/PulE/Tfp pilus assembly ATPase PilB-like protein